MSENKQASPVKASVSVPIKEQAAFTENKDNLMNALEQIGQKMSFSHLVRLVVNTATIVEINNEKHLVVKL